MRNNNFSDRYHYVFLLSQSNCVKGKFHHFCHNSQAYRQIAVYYYILKSQIICEKKLVANLISYHISLAYRKIAELYNETPKIQ